MNDLELLAEFAARGAEDAFTELVNRHLGLVYSAALRQTGDAHLAEEVTQAVFIIFARKAASMRPGASVAGWLYRTSRFAARDALKSQYRRQQREQQAFQMETTSADDSPWLQIAPLLEEAMAGLAERDRTAVLLRFFENKSLEEVGGELGVSPDSARMRVTRAIEKLRRFLTRRGVALSVTAIAGLLSANAVQAAPSGLAGTTAATALLQGASGSLKAFAIAKGTLKAMTWVKLKIAATASAAIVLAATAGVIVAKNLEPKGPPDPVALLKNVANAREKIASGEVEYHVSRYDFTRPEDGTNEVRLLAVFQGDRRRFEDFDTEYSYVMMGPDAGKVTDAKRKELGLDRAGAVKAGLLSSFESHRVIAYDGSALMTYWETDGKSFQTDIRDPREGSGSYVFDPRTLGISTSLFIENTIDRCLRFDSPRSVKLLGKEDVDGHSTWHVQIPVTGGGNTDFWMDAARPTHVIRCDFNGDTTISRYNPGDPSDPLPVEVLKTDYYTLNRDRVDTRFTRIASRFNARVDPASWTLAGLKMQVGTPVVDVRIHRRIGYWNGTGLAENLPRASKRAVQPAKTDAPDPGNLLRMAAKDPKSEFALSAATWVVLNTPDGPLVEKAGGIILDYHARSTNLVFLCRELERLRHRSAVRLLETILEKNPDRAVQANACFALATLLKEQANDQGNQELAERAAALFERVVSEYNDIPSDGGSLSARAEPEMLEIRRLGVGKEAPEIEGFDLDGKRIKLSDFRGKTVALVFWGTWCGPCMAMVPEERALMERMAGKKFAIVGVNSDRDAAKAQQAAVKEGMSWPSFQDGDSPGPIAKAWNVNSWPTVYVLDEKGIIRYRNVRGKTLDDAVQALTR